MSAATSLTCETSLRGQRIELDGLDATLTDVLVRVKSADGASAGAQGDTRFARSRIVGRVERGECRPPPTSLLGVEHILFGVDHLLFVLALVLLIAGVRR